MNKMVVDTYKCIGSIQVDLDGQADGLRHTESRQRDKNMLYIYKKKKKESNRLLDFVKIKK